MLFLPKPKNLESFILNELKLGSLGRYVHEYVEKLFLKCIFFQERKIIKTKTNCHTVVN